MMIGKDNMQINQSWLLRFVAAALLIIIVTSQIPLTISMAQNPSPGWEDPINVSQTGGTTQPAFAIDSLDNLHVFWNDIYADQGSAQWDGQEWTSSTGLTFNFAPASPQILSDQQGYLHAFWIDTLGVLSYSRVLAQDSENPISWTSPIKLGLDAMTFYAAIGNNDRLYVAYLVGLSTDATPSGVYVRAYDPAGAGWGAVTPIFQSQYFRGLTSVNAHLHISIAKGANPDAVFVAWDDAPQQRVYLSKSLDDGVAWSEPFEIDGPRPGEIPPGPFNIQTIAYASNLLVLWQSGLQSAFDCKQNYQFSDDLGETWQDPSQMFTNFVGCPQSNQLFYGADDLIFVLTKIQETSFLVAWDGDSWSSPQSQQILDSFSDPVSYNLVKLEGLRAAVNSLDELYVVGSDTIGNGDTWLLSRPLGTRADWFPPETSWSRPQVMLTTDLNIDSLQVLSDQDGTFSAIWHEVDSAEHREFINITQFDGVTWSDPVEMIKSPDKNIGDLSVLSAPDGKLYVVWNGKTTGEIYFAWANANKSISPFEWSDPSALPLEGRVTSPALSGGIDGELLVTYAVPINEDRGIYFVRSADQGETWSEPQLIFNASQNGWEMVGQPRLIQVDNDVYHAMWTKNSILEDGAVTGLYAATSRDGGLTWEGPQEIVDHTIQSSWLEQGAGILHRLWEGENVNNPGIWHDVSSDAGTTWQRSIPISVLGEIGEATAGIDMAGHVHLFQSYRSDLDQRMILHFWWDGQQWQSSDAITYESQAGSIAHEVAASVNHQGKIMVVALTRNIDFLSESTFQELSYSTRILEAALVEVNPPVQTVAAVETTQPVVVASPTVTSQETANAVFATPTPTVPVINQTGSQPPSTSNNLTIIIGAIASALVILFGFVFVYKKVR